MPVSHVFSALASLLFVLITCTLSVGQQESKSTSDSEKAAPPAARSEDNVRLPELRDELKQRVKRDQDARFAMIEATKKTGSGFPMPKELMEKLTEIDRDNTTWLKKRIEQHGWPGKSLVGTEGAHHAWLLVQHADQQPEFQQNCLELMNKMDPGEVAPKDVAYLTDRVLIAQGKPQRFGTQCQIVDGKASVKEVEDRDNLNQRRKQVGLPPIEEYLKQVESLYGGKRP